MKLHSILVEDNSFNRNAYLYECYAASKEEALDIFNKRKPQLQAARVLRIEANGQLVFNGVPYSDTVGVFNELKKFRCTVWYQGGDYRSILKAYSIGQALEIAKKGHLKILETFIAEV